MKTTQQKRIQSLVYFAIILILGLVGLTKSATLPDLAERTGSSISQITYILTVGSLGTLLGNYLGGRLYDRVQGHRVLMGSLLLAAVLFALVPFVNALWQLLPLFFVVGIAHGSMDLGANTLTLWVHGAASGPFMNALHFCFGIGAFLAPLIVSTAVTQLGSFNWAYWFVALLMVPVAWFARLVPSPEVRKPEQHNPNSLAAAGKNTNIQLLVVISLFLLFYVGSEIAFSGWIFTYAETRLPAELTVQAYWIASAFWIAMTAGRLAGIPLSSRLPTRLLLFLDLAGSVVSIGLIVFGGASLGTLWAGTLLLGVSMASIFPLTMTLAEQLMNVTGRITSILSISSGLGGLLLPWLLGQLFEWISPDSIMVALLATILIDAVLFGILFLLIPRSKTHLQG
ncbi:MAG: MFS transporter [Anaerolineae bacterium]|nr:MFS transporter [Anaerolineae bacterium]